MKVPHNTYRNEARIAGILFLAAIVFGILSLPFLGMIEEPGYLLAIHENETRLITGALLVTVMGFACAGIAIWLYPALKEYNEAMALAAVGFRVMECVLFITSAAVLLPLTSLSQEYVAAGAPVASHFQTVGELTVGIHDALAAKAGAIAFCLGALMYYILFYRSRLIPRWLSAWGIVAILLHLIAVSLVIFGQDPFSTVTVLLNLPILFNELTLAVWLIAKGFHPPQ